MIKVSCGGKRIDELSEKICYKKEKEVQTNYFLLSEENCSIEPLTNWKK